MKSIFFPVSLQKALDVVYDRVHVYSEVKPPNSPLIATQSYYSQLLAILSDQYKVNDALHRCK